MGRRALARECRRRHQSGHGSTLVSRTQMIRHTEKKSQSQQLSSGLSHWTNAHKRTKWGLFTLIRGWCNTRDYRRATAPTYSNAETVLLFFPRWKCENGKWRETKGKAREENWAGVLVLFLQFYEWMKRRRSAGRRKEWNTSVIVDGYV